MSDIDKKVWFPLWQKWRDSFSSKFNGETMSATAHAVSCAHKAYEAAFKAGVQHQAAQSKELAEALRKSMKAVEDYYEFLPLEIRVHFEEARAALAGFDGGE